MRPLIAEQIRWLAALLAAALLVTLVALVVSWFGVEEPGRWARKGLVPFVILAYAVLARLDRAALRTDLGRFPADLPQAARTYALGFAGGVASLLPLCGVLVAVGGFRFFPDRVWPELWDRGPRYLLAAVPLVVLEETLFRGLLHARLQRAAGVSTAVVLGSGLFATAHFLRAPDGRPLAGTAGALDAALGSFAGLATIPGHWTDWVGLFGVGLVLAGIRVRSGGIVLPMGIHAGWFWVRSVDGAMFEEVRPFLRAAEPWLVTKRYYDGVLGWIAIASVLLMVRWIPRSSGSRESAPPPGNGERSL